MSSTVQQLTVHDGFHFQGGSELQLNFDTLDHINSEEDMNHMISRSEPVLNNLSVSNLIIDEAQTTTTYDSPRIVRAREKLNRILKKKMESDGFKASIRKSLRAKSMFFGIGNNPQQEDNQNDTKARKLSSVMQDIISGRNTSGLFFDRLNPPPISLMKLTHSSFNNEIFEEMKRCLDVDDCKTFRTIAKKKLVDVNTISKGSLSLLHEASYKGCVKCIKSILKHGGDVNVQDDMGWSPLHAAIAAKNLDAVKMLLHGEACVNKSCLNGWSPLLLAVYMDELDIVHELICNGGDPLLCNKANISPFQLSINLKRGLILDYFLHLSCFLVEK